MASPFLFILLSYFRVYYFIDEVVEFDSDRYIKEYVDVIDGIRKEKLGIKDDLKDRKFLLTEAPSNPNENKKKGRNII